MKHSIALKASVAAMALFAKADDNGIDDEMKTIVKSLKDSFKEAKGRSINLSDKVLAMVIDRAGDKMDEMSDDETFTFIEQAEKEAQSVGVADAGITTLVSKFDGEFSDELEACIDAVVKNKTTAIDMYGQLARVWTMEELDGCPMPGTDEKTVWGNYRPDKVETATPSGVPIKTVWSNDLVSYMPKGKELEGIIDEVAKETKTPGSVPRLKGKSAKELESIKKSATQKRNAIRSMLKRAIALHHQWRAVEAMPLVGVKWMKPQHGDNPIALPQAKDYGKGLDHDTIMKTGVKVSSAPSPIYIWPSDMPEEGRIFSVTQFLNFDIPEAIANGGTMAALVATGGRGAGDGEDGTGDGSEWDVDTVEVTTSQLVNCLNKRENMALIRKRVADKKGAGNDLLDNLGSLYLLLKPIYEQNKAAYDNLQVREDADSKQAAA